MDLVNSKNLDLSTPSLVTRFTAWVRSQPIPGIIFYSALLLFASMYSFSTRWLAGVLPGGPWTVSDIYRVFSGPWLSVSILAFYYYFDAEIAEAVEDSRQVSGLSAVDFEKVMHDFVVIPLWPHLIVGIVFSVAAVQAAIVEEGFTSVQATNLLVLFEWIVTAIITFGFAFRLVRLIVLTGKFYSGPVQINLYNLPPLYHVSSAVSKAGIFFLVIWYMNLPFNINEFVLESPFALSSAVIVSLVPLAAFLIPQLVISRRMLREKEDLLVDVSLQLQESFGTFKKALQTEDFERVRSLKVGIDTLFAQRDFIDNIPILPWRLGTFRVAVTAVLLPVVVWLIQQILDSFLGL